MKLDYNHLSDEQTKKTWYDNIFVRDMPKRAFNNSITGNFMLSLAAMYKECVKNVDNLRSRFRI